MKKEVFIVRIHLLYNINETIWSMGALAHQQIELCETNSKML